jgi:hypothetical protein
MWHNSLARLAEVEQDRFVKSLTPAERYRGAALGPTSCSRAEPAMPSIQAAEP